MPWAALYRYISFVRDSSTDVLYFPCLESFQTYRAQFQEKGHETTSIFHPFLFEARILKKKYVNFRMREDRESNSAQFASYNEIQ